MAAEEGNISRLASGEQSGTQAQIEGGNRVVLIIKSEAGEKFGGGPQH